jgi:hypothetical protein
MINCIECSQTNSGHWKNAATKPWEASHYLSLSFTIYFLKTVLIGWDELYDKSATILSNILKTQFVLPTFRSNILSSWCPQLFSAVSIIQFLMTPWKYSSFRQNENSGQWFRFFVTNYFLQEELCIWAQNVHIINYNWMAAAQSKCYFLFSSWIEWISHIWHWNRS